MGDEMRQVGNGMPTLTLEPELEPEQKKEPEVQNQGQLMEVAPEMDLVQQKMAQTVMTPEEQKMVRDYLCDQYTPQSKLGKSLIGLILRSRSALCEPYRRSA